MTSPVRTVTLLTRAGCGACDAALRVLVPLCAEYGVACESVDVDAVAPQDPDLRAEYGDRLPVVLLDGREHSYWDVDVPRLRRDLEN
ncbi:glutaredoxin family protein [Rhodococcus sp. BP-149]|jgi:glutaredoxin|uniref:glutaredoxin family protein n=1 Tax=unclassified Rhodococcus (in: high G+C Gram-positive bacteria) TaxID=192944 RepID=UPI001C9B74CB|nr:MULTISPECIES: glutaredoxin family protein [unclassified Rhodococcus (in: high G+C Gram-positive bacteria)]MBY6684951.1 glutaredoxin family protein [Rhodococcus sp. BP-288]MBY6692565.1 glutaredoxin family protein [Rhodococcus sp. BP-188]MBY6698463.1 glutaredoxin family protein [Rhodococcus sp. BP-285]MBY6701142.1 glutaredoxin family protein [Rhodococcus sp. BP-283]MBY6712143.1 glutaredoxin family protein [Rhodococcus sp. BP-160]